MPLEAPTTCPRAPTTDHQRGNGRDQRLLPRHARRFPDFDDGLPVVFTWPVLGSTVHPEDFLFTLTAATRSCRTSLGSYRTGSSTSATRWSSRRLRQPRCAGIGAVYPTKLEIVDDGTPLPSSGPMAKRAASDSHGRVRAPRAAAPGHNSSGPSSTMSAMRRPAKAARRFSSRDCCPTTSSRSTAAVTSACAC